MQIKNKENSKIITLLLLVSFFSFLSLKIYYAGVNTKASINEFVTLLNVTDNDLGANATLELIISSSNLYKFGSTKSTGSIVPSPFGWFHFFDFIFFIYSYLI